MEAVFQQYFNSVSSIALSILSLVFNILVIIVYMSKNLRGQSMSRYLTALAISNLIELYSSILMNNSSTFSFSSTTCKIDVFFVMAFFQYCSFIIMIISIDRWVSVRFPKRMLIKDTLKFQVFVLVGAFLLTIPNASSAAAYYDMIKIDNETSFCDYADIEKGKYIIISIFIASTIIPLIEMIACSIFVWIALRKSRQRIKSKEKSDFKKENRLFRVMICMHCFFFICNSPICSYVILTCFRPDLNETFIFIVLNVLSVFHNTFSFVVHFTSNNVFRQQVFYTVCRMKSKSNNRVMDISIRTNMTTNAYVHRKNTVRV